MSSIENSQSVSTSEDRSAFTAAFKRRAQEIAAVTDDQLVAINIDVNQAVTTVLGTLREIAPLRPAMAKLADIDQKVVDGLEDYALATGEANSRYATALSPREDIVALNNQALQLRDTLRSDAMALAHRGLIDPARLAVFKGLIGYKNVAFELVDYVTLLRDVWPTIQGKTAITESELADAKEVGEHLVRAVGQREQAPTVVGEAAHVRQQAFALMMNAYDEVRRAITFLRWKADDVESIAPSLYARSGRSKPTPTADTTAVSGTPDAVTTPVASNTAHAGSHAIPPGMPGSSPFTN
jgi:hypothetical protein